jgi:hypothetical protein
MMRLRKHTRNGLILWALILLTSFLLMSCGARKAESSKTKEAAKAEFSDQSKSEQAEQSQTKGETNVKKSEQIIISDNNQSQTIIETVQPVDPTKLATYKDKNGKLQELNNAKVITQTTTQKNNTKTGVETKTEASGKSESQSNKKGSENKDIKAKSGSEKLAKEKVVNREAWSIFNFLWLLVPAAVLYYVWKNRVKIGKKITGVWWV